MPPITFGMPKSVMTSVKTTSAALISPYFAPGSVMVRSTTPSFTWSTSCGGVPPMLMAGNTWHFSLLADSLAILSHQGAITFTDAMAWLFQM